MLDNFPRFIEQSSKDLALRIPGISRWKIEKRSEISRKVWLYKVESVHRAKLHLQFIETLWQLALQSSADIQITLIIIEA